jgi:hypothetical protein
MAATDARPIRNAPYRIRFGFITPSGNLIPSAPSPAGKVAQNQISFTDTSTSPQQIGTSGMYFVDLTAAEMSANSVDFIGTSTGSAQDVVRHIDMEPSLESGVATAGTANTITLRSSASSTADFFNNAIIEIVRGVGSGQVRTIIDYDTAKKATVDLNWLVVPNDSSVYLIHPDLGIISTSAALAAVDVQAINSSTVAADNMGEAWKGVIVDTVTDPTPTTTSFIGSSNLSSTDDFYKDQTIFFTSGVALGQQEQIISYIGSSRTINLATALPIAPGNGDSFVILGRVL